MRSKAIWATNATALNDAGEIRFGMGAVWSALTAFKALTADSLILNFLELAGTQFASMKEKIGDVFIASFTNSRNKLAQWRYYGNREGGFALGFDPKKLAHVSVRYLVADKPTLITAGPYPVTYGEKAIRSHVQSLLTLVSDGYRHAMQNTQSHAQEELTRLWAGRLTGYLWSVGATGKHEDFSDEAEWRLVVTPILFDQEGQRQTGVIRLSPREGVIIAYIEIDDVLGALTEVWVGPGRFQSINEGSAHIAIANAGLNAIPVHKSSSSFQIVR